MSVMPSEVPGRFGTAGAFGGRYVSETLLPSLDELTTAWQDASQDPAFTAELDHLLADYVGRPTPLATSTPSGCTARTAAATFSGRSPPASQNGRDARAAMSSQGPVVPLPP